MKVSGLPTDTSTDEWTPLLDRASLFREGFLGLWLLVLSGLLALRQARGRGCEGAALGSGSLLRVVKAL